MGLEAHVQVRGEDWCKPTEGRKMHGAQARSVSGLRILHGEVDEVLREVRFQVLQRQVHGEVRRQEVQRIFLQVCWGACSLDDRSLSPWSIFLRDVDARVSLRSAQRGLLLCPQETEYVEAPDLALRRIVFSRFVADDRSARMARPFRKFGVMVLTGSR